ncbi:hypothetical protein [Pasteurella testudinis]|uniref:hypothetical protein n=1 Tax=Pasteurella testudinis TaxID=761 RepID=UPI0040584A21
MNNNIFQRITFLSSDQSIEYIKKYYELELSLEDLLFFACRGTITPYNHISYVEWREEKPCHHIRGLNFLYTPTHKTIHDKLHFYLTVNGYLTHTSKEVKYGKITDHRDRELWVDYSSSCVYRLYDTLLDITPSVNELSYDVINGLVESPILSRIRRFKPHNGTIVMEKLIEDIENNRGAIGDFNIECIEDDGFPIINLENSYDYKPKSKYNVSELFYFNKDELDCYFDPKKNLKRACEIDNKETEIPETIINRQQEEIERLTHLITSLQGSEKKLFGIEDVKDDFISLYSLVELAKTGTKLDYSQIGRLLKATFQSKEVVIYFHNHILKSYLPLHDSDIANQSALSYYIDHLISNNSYEYEGNCFEDRDTIKTIIYEDVLPFEGCISSTPSKESFELIYIKTDDIKSLSNYQNSTIDNNIITDLQSKNDSLKLLIAELETEIERLKQTQKNIEPAQSAVEKYNETERETHLQAIAFLAFRLTELNQNSLMKGTGNLNNSKIADILERESQELATSPRSKETFRRRLTEAIKIFKAD